MKWIIRYAFFALAFVFLFRLVSENHKQEPRVPKAILLSHLSDGQLIPASLNYGELIKVVESNKDQNGL